MTPRITGQGQGLGSLKKLYWWGYRDIGMVLGLGCDLVVGSGTVLVLVVVVVVVCSVSGSCSGSGSGSGTSGNGSSGSW